LHIAHPLLWSQEANGERLKGGTGPPSAAKEASRIKEKRRPAERNKNIFMILSSYLMNFSIILSYMS